MAAYTIFYTGSNGNWDQSNAWNTATDGSGTAFTDPQNGENTFVCVAHNKTITINKSVNVTELRNDTTGGATAGGQFTVSAGGYTITANIFSGGTANRCVYLTHTSGTTTYNGDVTGGSASSKYGIEISSAATLYHSGSAIGGSGASSAGIYLGHSSCVYTQTTGTVKGGSAGYGIMAGAFSTVTINGEVTVDNSTYNSAIRALATSGTPVMTINGTVWSSISSNATVNNTGTTSVIIAQLVKNQSSCKSPAITSSATGTSYSYTYVRDIDYNGINFCPISGAVSLDPETGSNKNKWIVFKNGGGSANMYPADQILPTAAQVESGVAFGDGMTGTLVSGGTKTVSMRGLF